MAAVLSFPDKERAVVGYLGSRGFAGIPSHARPWPDAFQDKLAAIAYAAALELDHRGRAVTADSIIEYIEGCRDWLPQAEEAARARGLPDWRESIIASNDSLVFQPGQAAVECLDDIAKAADQRKGTGIGLQLHEGEISLEAAFEALRKILEGRVAQQIEPLLDARRIDLARKPPEPQLVFGLAGHKISTAGNLTVIAAQAKAGKTAAVSAMVARVFSDRDEPGDFLGFEAAPSDGKAVILFDTEQSPFDAWRVMSRCLRRAGLDSQPSNLRGYYLLDLTIEDRRRALQEELKRAERECGGIHSIVVDGVADLLEDVNDTKESNALVNELVALAVRYFCPVVCILHENPGKPQEAWKTRGHLGSQLERKAESNLRVKKDLDGVSVIYSERGCRHAEIPEPTAPRFKFCEKTGMHISCEPAEATKAAAEREELVEEVREIFNTPDGIAGFSWKDTHERIRTVHSGLSFDGARKRFAKLKKAGLIKRNAAGLYIR